MNARSIVVISDFQEGWPPVECNLSIDEYENQWRSGERGPAPRTHVPNRDTVAVDGGYLERLPLACVKAGLADHVEIWHHWRGNGTPPYRKDSDVLARRAFTLNTTEAPFSSNDMLAYIRVFGAPAILCVYGLGVSEDILLACADSFKIYNSIDAPALRIPAEVSRHFDLIITGAQWQSDEVEARHPGMKTAIMPVGPEFASETTFYPDGDHKPYDLIYVAAAQGYKRHDILFDALEKLPRSIRTLCVFGYGELSDSLRERAQAQNLNIDFIGPPGVPIHEVRTLMNQAKIGVVCGVRDGAPAILTEYMLCGLPVLANAELCCGLQYITPETGVAAPAETFHLAIEDMLGRLTDFSPRDAVLANWTWPHTLEKLRALMGFADAPDYAEQKRALSQNMVFYLNTPPPPMDPNMPNPDLAADASSTSSKAGPLICFSHLRWDFVLQRPQHLMERFSKHRQVFFFEEYIPTDHHLAYLEIHPFAGTYVKAIRPRIPHWWNEQDRENGLKTLLDELLALHGGSKPVLWFYTPLMFSFAQHVDAAAVIYDCMDELANFKFASPQLKASEQALIRRADAVFTGGYSLFEAKAHLHDNIHPFPSSVDVKHFGAARGSTLSAQDQAGIKGPRLGFYGVIDERLDLGLIAALAKAKPDWSIVLVGPVAKLSAEELPRATNIHYLGQRNYADLPAYLAGWDVALMPFAMNEATRFISPTKTPEYLASGRPVVSTPINDVVRHYGDLEGVFMADTAAAFIAACEKALALAKGDGSWLKAVDTALSGLSWDETYRRMQTLVDDAVSRKRHPAPVTRLTPRRSASTTPSKAPYDYLIVGAGFAGSVLAERLAADGNKRVLVCDRRPHIAGNAFDFHNEHGILVHKYGPHIFHTNSEDIFNYLSRFTGWRPYEHRVLASVDNKLLPIPINRTTLNGLYGLNLKNDAEAAEFLASKAEPTDKIVTSKDVVVAQVGQHLYKTFFEGYTRKQWGLDPSELDKAVTARIPTRTSTDDRYFLDTFQAMPLLGYTHMFENMLSHDNITVMLETDFKDVRKDVIADHTIFTGPIDEYFDYCYGRLPYRSLTFQHETHDTRRFQPVAVVNYPGEDVGFTRITEYKFLTGQVHPKTSISYEFSSAEGDPYYPIPRPENQALYKQYEELARSRDDVTFVGRLGTYKYYNMDQVVGQAVATYRRLMKADAGPMQVAAARIHD